MKPEQEKPAIEINDVGFTPVPGIKYARDYADWLQSIQSGKFPQKQVFRELCLNDLFFLTHFIMKVPNCNRPFVVERCKEVESTPDDVFTLDLWARFHWKSTILTKARTIQRILRNPEKCTMIASHSRPMARSKFLRPIMLELETNEFLKWLFDDILYDNPRSQSPKWSEDDGIIIKRKSKSRSEATVEGHGIKEGMPIGVHFDYIILDDLETKDDVRNPDVIEKVREAVNLSSFLLTEDGGSISIVGTPYSHEAVYYPFIINKKLANGEPRYRFRRYPATDDGTLTGKPVLMTQSAFDDLVAEFMSEGMGQYNLNCQMLINPTPIGDQKLNPDFLIEVDEEFIPKSVFSNLFLIVDPAGDKTGKKSNDAWGVLVVGADPEPDLSGHRKIYLVDAVIEQLAETEAVEIITRRYMSYIIRRFGYERFGNQTPGVMVHVMDSLKQHGRRLIENDNLFWLNARGRRKEVKILEALSWPLNNGKIHISRKIPAETRNRLKNEMRKFPFWHDDGIDALSYYYDLTEDFNFFQANRWSKKTFKSLAVPA